MSQSNQDILRSVGLSSYQMSLSINLAQRSFNDLLKTCLSHHGLTIPRWSLLGAVYAEGKIRPISVAKQLGIKPPYIAKLIAALEAEGLIVTEPYPDDERGKMIRLSQQGCLLVERVEPLLESCLQEQLGSLQTADVTTYFALSNYIATHVHHH